MTKVTIQLKEIIFQMHIICVLLFPIALLGQSGILLNNPSFEDEPQDAKMPQGWWGVDEGTTPDILPGFWGVRALPADGQTYVGLITRADGSQESIGQRLHPRLEKGGCYQFYLHLARSRKYVGYTDDIQCRIWVSTRKKKKQELIFTSPKIDHRDWKRYLVNFTAKDDYKYIIIESYTEEEGTKGHILIDALSGIQLCDKASL
jgi:hypothetical protein